MSEQRKYVFTIESEGETYWYVAHSVRHVLELFVTSYESDLLQDATDVVEPYSFIVERVLDNEEIALCDRDEGEDETSENSATKTAAVWAAETDVGLLCSTVY